MKSFQNAATVKVTPDHFTQHGLHLNRKGKKQAAKIIASSIKEIFKLQKEDPIYLSWREKQRMEQVNTGKANVKKDDGQISQANVDQEQLEYQLPSKQARRLPITRHDDFLWPNIHMDQ